MNFAISLTNTCVLLTAQKIDHFVAQSQNSCHAHFGRNSLVAQFMKSDATHLLQIDDDMGFDPLAVLKMLAFDRDFIAGAGNLKTDEGKDYACKILVNIDETPVVDEKDLILASHVGGAFTLIKKSVIARMIQAYPELKCTRIDPDDGYRFYEDRYEGNGFETEDYTFCRRWTSIGGQIWIYPDIDFVHSGNKDYRGNYHEFLKVQERPAEYMEMKQSRHAWDHRFDVPADPTVAKTAIEIAIDKTLTAPAYIESVAKAIERLQKQMETV